ncbi:hypothetical protein K505DRAFT_253399 [Melanomma pulvis-pyrius CBS 109.77]|uniref:Uncharacterized protein n=1 Tax=Melanomma pulvis-pyrius CBS 109.77 TaxID=1314802 RepID=A0A6A6WZT7_9PLEO|nr:hypothetical protein K505DRAFT_253399 [Melanomma pulvis-pyrius CBS 109.77]
MDTGVAFDPLSEYEPHNTVYTLTVCAPPRPPPSWLPEFFTREPISYKNYVPERDFRIEPDPAHKSKDRFGPQDLDDMMVKQIMIKSYLFPPELRCQHVQGRSRICNKGCYVLERGGTKEQAKCSSKDCEGHAYGGDLKRDDEGYNCFGKKGERLVAIKR